MAPNNRTDDQGLARGDQQIGNNDRISVRYFRSVGNTPGWLNPTDVLENQNALYWLNTSASVTETHIFAPTLTNQALFSFNRTNGINTPVYPPKTFHDLGINVFSDQYPEWKFGVSSYFTIGTGDTNQFLRDEYQFTDTVRWTKGRHEMSFGGEYARGYGRVINDYRADGTFNFNGGSAPFTGDSFADALVGKFYDFQQGAGEYRNTYFNRIGLFAQDAWRVRPNFTVNLGVRWEPFFPYTEADGKLAAWHPGQQSQRFINAPVGVVFPGDAGVPDGGYPAAWRNLAPRVGFAWNVFGDGKTAVRGGYGIFYDQPDTLYMNSQVDQAPFGTLVDTFGTTGNSLKDPYAGSVNPFPASNTPPKDAYFPQYSSQFLFAPQMRNPYVQSWNLTAEHELKGGFILRASYAGSKGTRLIAIRELNQAVYAPGVTTSTTNQRRPYGPGIGSLAYVEPVGNSSFNAFQFTMERRFAKGFSILANYQFAKSLDDASINKGNAIDRTNTNNQGFDKGRSDFDRAHVFHFSSLWELPIHPQNGVLKAIAGGWNVNSIVVLESGLPFSVSSGVDNARTGTSGQRADLIGNPYLPDGRSRGAQITAWLNTAAFATNALNTFGSLGRNMFNGPGLATTDLGLAKSFHIGERVRSTLRFEAFNAFNRVNLNVNGLDRTVTDSKFMQTTSAFDPRILQIALRLTF